MFLSHFPSREQGDSPPYQNPWRCIVGRADGRRCGGEPIDYLEQYGRDGCVLAHAVFDELDANGGAEVSAAIVAEARLCNSRNVDRYRSLTKAGKRKNVAKVAVASELVRQMWAIGNIVRGELQQG